MDRSTVEKAVFVVSLAVLAYLLGFATNTFGWFPADFLQEAWLQARHSTSAADEVPSFVNPRVHDREGVREEAPGAAHPGARLVSSMWPDYGWTAGLKLISRRGSVVHEWRTGADRLFPDSLTGPGIGRQDIRYVHGSHLFPNGDVLVNVESKGTARLDACGRILWRLPAGTHHSIARADDGSFWVPARRWEDRLSSPSWPDGYPGLSSPGFHDRVLRVSASGRILETISVLDLLYANGLQRHIVEAGRLSSDDVTHLNDVEPLPETMEEEYPRFSAGDLLLSLRDLNLVLVLDPETEDVKWYDTEPFVAQHDPDFIGRGWIGVFDNGRDGTERGTLLKGSRVVELRPSSDSVRVRFPTARSEPFYTAVGGKWQELGNGNALLTEMQAGRAIEVAPDGRTVWEWVQAPYGASHVPEVYEVTRYGLTPGDVAAWPCSPGDATPGGTAHAGRGPVTGTGEER